MTVTVQGAAAGQCMNHGMINARAARFGAEISVTLKGCHLWTHPRVQQCRRQPHSSLCCCRWGRRRATWRSGATVWR